RLAAGRLRLGSVEWRRATGETLGRAAGRLSAEARHLRALAPSRVLDRGYAVVRDAEGRVVRRAGDLEAGDRLLVTLASGAVATRVAEIIHG
ncbi:MAG: exodeoxyribonuclease VII large subunit, partial [Actinomycetota bacterium]|nr:exodeoxyribonuclease VII large subunit [Actinomycetota bacterium]